MESTSQRRGHATTVTTLMGIAAVTTLLFVKVGAQEQGSTRHQSSLPQITTGGQKDWPLHNLDIHGSRYADLDEINTSTVSGLDAARVRALLAVEITARDGPADRRWPSPSGS